MQLPLQVHPFFETRAALWCSEGLFCALRGGADSIALALVMHELQLPFTALHCNFHLRGDESDADEHFVREFCAAHDIPLKVKHFDVDAQCQKTGESIEMAARTLRYDWFSVQGGYVLARAQWNPAESDAAVNGAVTLLRAWKNNRHAA